MKPTEYRRLREQIGTREQVAVLLDVSLTTIAHREQGEAVVRREAALAIVQLVARERIAPTQKVTRLKPQYGKRR